MVWVDWAIIGVIVISALLSLWRGFVREAVALTGWVLAFFLARAFHGNLAPYLSDDIRPAGVKFAIAWVAIFLVVLFVSYLLAKLGQVLIDKAGLTTPDRLLGMAFGVLRGLAVCAALVIVSKAFTRLPESKEWQQARLVSPLETVGDWFLSAWQQQDANDEPVASI
ncbi:CvpA family protein [Permianibacter sp. IMCC34836]|uniref:CvpA family protein n=1 Tax=Permianibacter fluminis TaxID=2738515 RepID=UPI00155507B9|nr:CvpA family protein [Permianibacter fluminis]NQD37537.1 CvpA family protein [Permianibacter fluminis]